MIQEARRRQITAAETGATAFKPVTEALLGKQPETKSLSQEEAKKNARKRFFSLIKEQREETVRNIEEMPVGEKRQLAEKLVEHIADPNDRRDRLNQLINNPLLLEQRLSELTTSEIKDVLEQLSEKLEDIGKEQERAGELTVKFLGVEEKSI